MTESFRKKWDSFFFVDVDARVYAYLRLMIGIILATYAMVLGPDWLQWFSEDGVLTLKASVNNIDPNTWSVLRWIPGTPTVLWIVYAVICIQIGMLLIGYKTRFQTVCLFVWFVSLHHRNNLLWEGGDILLRVTLFLMMFMPLGALWSVDAKLGKKKNSAPVWPLRLLQIQLSLLYFSSVGEKLRGMDWLNGHALYYVSRLDDTFGRFIPLQFTLENLWIYQILTWLALATEFLLIWGVWIPAWRRNVVIIGVLFHLGLELSMNLFVFQWLMIIILLTFLFRVDDAKAQLKSSAAVLRGN